MLVLTVKKSRNTDESGEARLGRSRFNTVPNGMKRLLKKENETITRTDNSTEHKLLVTYQQHQNA